MFTPSKFKIWYNHQVPGPSYEREVPNPEVGQQILDTIYDVALYQFRNNMIPDYANSGGIVYLDEDGEWSDYDPDDWEDAYEYPDDANAREHAGYTRQRCALTNLS